MSDHNSSTDDPEIESIDGEVVSTRFVEHRDTDFERYSLNSLEFRGLEGGTYKLVKVSDDCDENTNPKSREDANDIN